MFFKSRKILTRVKSILGRHSGGIYKRIDHNREILEVLRRDVPDFKEKPWLESKLESHDEFFCALAEEVVLDDVQFAATPPDYPGRPFPRPWPEKVESRLPQTSQLDCAQLQLIEARRNQFEVYWLGRGVKTPAKTQVQLERDDHNDYLDDSTQRHWWTWQNALKDSTSHK